jgi:hypothetical protein
MSTRYKGFKIIQRPGSGAVQLPSTIVSEEGGQSNALDSPRNRRVHADAMVLKVGARRHERLEWRVDLVEVNIGDKAVDGGVDARWLRPEHGSAFRQKVRQRPQIRQTPFVNGGCLVASDALIVISLEIVFSRRLQGLRRDCRMCLQKRVAE